SSALAPAEVGWQQTALGRTVVGLMLAQGLYYGLLQLSSAVIVGIGNTAIMAEWSHSPPDGWVWWLMQGIQVVSVLVGGVMAGAGQRRAFLLGLLLGLINGSIFLGAQFAVQQASGKAPDALVLSPQTLGIQMMVQMVCGAIGGFLGGFIWK